MTPRKKETAADRLRKRIAPPAPERRTAPLKYHAPAQVKRFLPALIRLTRGPLKEIDPRDLVRQALHSKPTDLNAVELKKLRGYLKAWNFVDWTKE